MFLSFDEIGAVPELGIPSGDGYVSIRDRPPEEIAALILERAEFNTRSAEIRSGPSASDTGTGDDAQPIGLRNSQDREDLPVADVVQAPRIIPNLDWYASISERRGVAVHCPFAMVQSCPRFYQSLSLLGSAGSTGIESSEDEHLKAYWQKSDLWPATREQETGIGSANGRPVHFTTFCPEVSFERFGYFASYLARYADELDSDLAHERLGHISATSDDPRWEWASVRAMHYTECPLYSVLKHRDAKSPDSTQNPV